MLVVACVCVCKAYRKMGNVDIHSVTSETEYCHSNSKMSCISFEEWKRRP